MVNDSVEIKIVDKMPDKDYDRLLGLINKYGVDYLLTAMSEMFIETDDDIAVELEECMYKVREILESGYRRN